MKWLVGSRGQFLHDFEFSIHDSVESGFPERPEYLDPVQTVEEFRREPPSCCSDSAIQRPSRGHRAIGIIHRGWKKPRLATERRIHLSSSDCTRHKNQGSGKIYLAIVAESQRTGIQDPEKPAPQCIRRALDLINEENTQLHGGSMVLIEKVLGEKSLG